ncbi:TonB-dependent receptor [Sulfidibacter corallicola]|uniref:TonB-dependent receptor n=1 Tax=Sulfidibacter corallicola TaxID=2818388 RepID=A0A8A4TU93_SULCO|nr:TonB-dependent receptor [Sulfidibacter corallicola]QTD52602.1 TonB-dependent receptor [Sulfidibacter corallicola]
MEQQRDIQPNGAQPFGQVARRMLGLLFLIFCAVPAFAQTGLIVGTVTDGASSQPLAGATILVVEIQKVAVSDEQGKYSLRVRPGNYKLLVTFPEYESVYQAVTVEADGEDTQDFEMYEALAQFGEELVVIGSRAARTAIETPVPVDVMHTDELKSTGMTETSKMLQFLAPSFNFSTSTISDGTDIVRPSTLRGLGPDQTLVLVNGKRRHTSALVHVNGSVGRGTAGVDMNAIPASAIERIEILRDGASAQYGSDAIAGVINLVLKDDVGTSFDVNSGQTYDEDGEVVMGSINHGWRIGDTGYLNLTAEFRDRGATNRAGLDPRQQYPSLADGSPDPRETSFDRLNHRYGDADSENLGFFLNGSFPLGDDSEIYVFGGYTDREGESGGFYRRSLDARNVPEVYPDGFLPLINTTVEDSSLSVGFKTLIANWVLDANVTTGGNSFEFDISNSVNVSLGTASPTEANAGTLEFNQTTAGLDLFGTVDWGLSSPVNLAFGVEWRQDNYQIEAGETASWVDGGVPNQFGERAAPGIQVFPGFRPANEVDEDRDNLALYAEMESNLSEQFLLSLAGRFEDYSDFGNNFSGKLAMRYTISEGLALRLSGSTGFRAPSLHQSFFNNTSTQFVFDEASGELVPFEVGTFRNNDEVTQAFGIPELKEETSVNASAGFTWKPMKSLSITADIYRIDIDDRVVVSGQFQDSADPRIEAILAPFNVRAAQFFTNAIDTETEGGDLVISWASKIGASSTLKITAAGNWNDTEVADEVAIPAQLEGLQDTLFNRIERERVQTSQPRSHLNLGLGYSNGGFFSNVRLNRFGSVKTVEVASNPDLDQVFGAKVLTDLDLGWNFNNGLRWSLGANNLFDVYPDENRTEISFNGIFVYPRRTAPFGFNGGSYYTRISYAF